MISGLLESADYCERAALMNDRNSLMFTINGEDARRTVHRGVTGLWQVSARERNELFIDMVDL